MFKTLVTVALFCIPGSSLVLVPFYARKLYVRYVHSNMETEREGLSNA